MYMTQQDQDVYMSIDKRVIMSTQQNYLWGSKNKLLNKNFF